MEISAVGALATEGAGIYNAFATLDVRGCNFSANTASGIYNPARPRLRRATSRATPLGRQAAAFSTPRPGR
jgi:hypothetical protein